LADVVGLAAQVGLALFGQRAGDAWMLQHGDLSLLGMMARGRSRQRIRLLAGKIRKGDDG
jgi:hypothetical protein